MNKIGEVCAHRNIENKNISGMVIYIYNPSTLEALAGGSSVQGQSWLQSNTLSQK
jgi:hypothetical protein